MSFSQARRRRWRFDRGDRRGNTRVPRGGGEPVRGHRHALRRGRARVPAREPRAAIARAPERHRSVVSDRADLSLDRRRRVCSWRCIECVRAGERRRGFEDRAPSPSHPGLVGTNAGVCRGTPNCTRCGYRSLVDLQLAWPGTVTAASDLRLPSTMVAPHLIIAAGIALVVGLAGVLAARGLSCRVRSLWLHLRQGGAIVRTPGRYFRQVVLLQLGGWVCRTGVAFTLLAAFGLPATVQLALLVVVAGGLSTLIPTPGGAGTQQVLLVYALQQTATNAAALSFSIGMQVGDHGSELVARRPRAHARCSGRFVLKRRCEPPDASEPPEIA